MSLLANIGIMSTASGGPPGSWADISPWSYGLTDSGWVNYTLRVVILSTSIVSTGTQTRFKITAPAGSTVIIGACYIGVQAGSGDPYDFASTPTQLLFSGSAGVTVSAGTTVYSDPVTFTVNGSQNLVCSAYFSGATNLERNDSVTGWSCYYAFNNSPGIVDPSGYSGYGTNRAMLFHVEAQ